MLDFTKGQKVAGDESGVWVFWEALRGITDSLKHGRQDEGVDGQHTTKPRKHAAGQNTMLRAKVRKLL